MTGSLPHEVQRVFDRFLTTEFTTVDSRGGPITWPVTPYYSPGAATIDVTTGLGYPKKARDARANPRVALLFSDPTGCGLDAPPTVLVQGTADVDDRDLDANRERYVRESLEKIPSAGDQMPPEFVRRCLNWYFTRIYVHVRPERVYVWPGDDAAAEPQLFDTHMEEVRSGHDEEPESPQAAPEGGGADWDGRMRQLGDRYTTAVLSFVAPDGFPFSVRVPVRADESRRRVLVGDVPVGAPLQPGLACLTAHDHDERFTWQSNFQLRGDLLDEDGSWSFVPHRMVGGLELPRRNLDRLKANLRKSFRFARTARREFARRS